MHWPIDPALLRPHIPPGLAIDTYTGGPFADQAFIAVVPFRMSGVRPRLTPGLPGVSAFPELNVRTYVRSPPTADEPRGRPGVWFFSLDAASRLAVEGARLTFHLAYFFARMGAERRPDGWIEYRSDRRDRRSRPASYRAFYRPTGPEFTAAPGSLESFLTDRYCLYAADRRARVYRAEIHHDPWPLRTAEAEIELNTMMDPLGIDAGRLTQAPDGAWPLLHYAERLDVVAWPARRIQAPRPGSTRAR
jgi:uncharacterized protein YqjF (DUF2071 family)